MRNTKAVQTVIHAADLGYFVTEEGEVLSPSGVALSAYETAGSDYLRVTVPAPDKKSRSIKVHLLAAYQWFGSLALQDGVQVRHLDGDGLNNRKSNLSIGDAVANAGDKDPAVVLRAAKKAARAKRKLTEQDVARLRQDRARGLTYKELGEKYGLAKSTISYIVRGTTYQPGAGS